MAFFNQKDLNENNQADANELEFNRKNREDFEQLMKESSTNLDGYYDSNNPFVKLLLLVLFLIIVGGIVYYLFTYVK